MTDVEFDCGNIPVAVAAKVLGVDNQTVRLLLQSGAVNWGIAYLRNPKNKNYSYLIYPKKFYESTGYIYRKGVASK